LYLTQSCLAFTTLLDFDLKGATDTTVVLVRSRIQYAVQGAVKQVRRGA
jgi:hypothetical protein